MSLTITPRSLDTNIKELLEGVNSTRIQLPEFQRSWTWDDNRIRGILATLSQGYPMGAIMQLQYGNKNIRFKYRTIEGVTTPQQEPDYLILDGQQRLTSIFQSTFSCHSVTTRTEKKKEIQRFYYLDINRCLDANEDRIDAVLSIPEDRKLKANFDRDILLDLSSSELEYQSEMFPFNIVFNSSMLMNWVLGYIQHWNNPDAQKKINRFKEEVLDTIIAYKLPVITLDKMTPRDAVCKVFENVNTGGVALNVFELVTASFATCDFNLRKDWEVCRDIIWGKSEPLNTDIMYGVDETSFLTAITLFTTFKSGGATSCKKKDVLSLEFEDYQKNKQHVLDGYKLARKFLLNQCVFRKRDLPYTTQLVPLAAICAELGKTIFEQPRTQKILATWYWCGIMGEMYGSANESRYANDIEDVVAVIRNQESLNRTIRDAYFSSTRLLSLQTRQSAAYKGIMALIYQERCQDFVRGTPMDAAKSMDESPDIHHIFPEAYCKKQGYKSEKWNSIVNKTPLLPESNRFIGGDAPSIYCRHIMRKAEISETDLRNRIESHSINYDMLFADDFEHYFIARAQKLLAIIEKAMGKNISDKNSEQTIQQFGCSLENNDGPLPVIN